MAGLDEREGLAVTQKEAAVAVEAGVVDVVVGFEGVGPVMAEEIEVAYGHRRFGSKGRGGIISAEVDEQAQTFLGTALVISLGEHIHAFSGELGSELDSACGHDVELVDHAGVVGIGAESPGTLNISLGER